MLKYYQNPIFEQSKLINDVFVQIVQMYRPSFLHITLHHHKPLFLHN